tara:strand:- start:9663 stop:10277 length:615 start_codon:yes stop_codon:yes gene_type:complete
MFWTSDINNLFKPILIPKDYMSDEEKLNTIVRFIIFISILFALISLNKKFLVKSILFIIIILIISYLIYNNIDKINKIKEQFLNSNKLTLINNELCNLPTNENPFMNNNIYDINTIKNNYNACQYSNKNIKNKINKITNNTISYDDNDIYGINPLHLVFYTVPNSKSNNDQKLFAEWLYKDFHTCKENGGNECFNNIHSDIRIK